jgi:hypothetical protein
VPRIADHFLDCVTYLYPDAAHAEAGDQIGASGFLLRFQDSNDLKREQIYIVTNWHVVESGNMTVRLNTQEGGLDVIDTDPSKWVHHPKGDDLAIYPLTLDESRFKYGCISNFNLLTKNTVQINNIGPGDDVFAIGRFINHEGKQRNLPTVRMGTIAQMPWEPIRTNGDFDQESFLVEVRSMGGYSGSPIILILPTFAPTRPGSQQLPVQINPSISLGPWLIGVSWGYLHGGRLPVYQDDRRETSYYAVSNSGLMAVVPAWKLQELLDHPPVVAARGW